MDTLVLRGEDVRLEVAPRLDQDHRALEEVVLAHHCVHLVSDAEHGQERDIVSLICLSFGLLSLSLSLFLSIYLSIYIYVHISCVSSLSQN